MFSGEADVSTFYQHEGGEMLPAMQVPQHAAGLCVEISEAYADHVHQNGGQATVVDVHHKDTGYAHTVVRQGDHIVDWSARQLDDHAPIPKVTPASEFLQEWAD